MTDKPTGQEPEDKLLDDLVRAAGRYWICDPHQGSALEALVWDSQCHVSQDFEYAGEAREHAARLNLAGVLERLAQDIKFCADAARWGLSRCIEDLLIDKCKSLSSDTRSEEPLSASVSGEDPRAAKGWRQGVDRDRRASEGD